MTPEAGTLMRPDVSAALSEHYAEVRRYVRGMARDAAEADDLTQETFLRASLELGSLRDPKALRAWLYRIATRICLDHYRRAARLGRAEPLDGDRPGGEVGEASQHREAEQAEMSACVQEVVSTLPDTYRSALLLHDLHGLTAPEIAAVCGASVETVKIRLHRARRKLRAALGEACEFYRDERDVLLCGRLPAVK